MSVPVIHDFVTLLFVYNDLLNTPHNKKMKQRRMIEVKKFFFEEDGRILKNSQYFIKNLTLVEAYRFICNVILFIENEEHKPKRKRLLKTN